MSNLEKYNKVFMDVFEVSEDQLSDLTYQSVSAWNSVGHMTLISSLEDAFNIMFDGLDIMELKSYEIGKKILEKEEYGVKF